MGSGREHARLERPSVPPTRTPAAPARVPARVPQTGKVARDRASVLGLQRSAGNRATAVAVSQGQPVVQRTELTLSGGGRVGDTDAPGVNTRENVLLWMNRLHDLWGLNNADYGVENPRVAALAAGAPVPVAQIPATIAAWRRLVQPTLSAPVSQTQLHVAISDGVGVGLANKKDDVAAIQDFVHAQWLLSNDAYGSILDAAERGVVMGSGATVDVGRIPRTIAALKTAMQMLITNTPFHGPVGAALSGPLAASETADIAAYDATKARHDANRTQAKQWVEDGFAQNASRTLKNSCEWVKTGKAKIFILTKTHDSVDRVTAWGHPAGAAWFSYPAGDLYGGTSYYRRKMPSETFDNTNVDLQESATVDGFSTGPDIALMETALAKGRDYLWSVLKHEIQHSADRHGAGDFEGYRTEFNAYWLGSREYDNQSATKIVRHMGRDWRARQWAIFNHLYTDTASYGYVKAAWDAEAGLPVASRTFRIAVRDYWHPQTVNPTNSVRVDNFAAAVEAASYADCTAAAAPGNPKLAAITAAAAALTANDKRDIRAGGAMGALLKAHLNGKPLKDVRKLLK